MPTDLVHIDGSYGEGGGQIVRTSASLSVLTGLPVHVDNVRAGRPQPGLKAQHALVLQALAELSGGTVSGAEVGSQAFVLRPGEPRAGDHRWDIGTAGSIPLFLQAVLPILLLTPGRSSVELVGGTDVAWAPTMDWCREVYVPWVTPVARSVAVHVDRRGFYPKGGGLVRVVVDNPADLPHPHGAGGLGAVRAHVQDRLGVDRWKQDWLSSARVLSVAERRLADGGVAERQADAAADALAVAEMGPAETQVEYVDALSMGSAVCVILEDDAGNRVAADRLGARGHPAEDVGREAVDDALSDWQGSATVDRHLADHLVPWVALGAGMVRVPEPTGHLTTNIWATRQFLGRRSVSLERDVLCHGKLG